MNVSGEYPVDTVAFFTCNYGYRLIGASTVSCELSGNWEQKTTTCNQSNQYKEYHLKVIYI